MIHRLKYQKVIYNNSFQFSKQKKSIRTFEQEWRQKENQWEK